MKQLAPLVEQESPLRVAITGHRRNRLTAQDEAALARSLRGFFDALDPDGTRQIDMANGMADGTDLVAARTRPAHWTLHMVLAEPAARWTSRLAALDPALSGWFDTALCSPKSRITTVSDGDPDYVRVAEVLVDNCDLLIAHWDGEPGKTGGTGSVVRLAQGRRIPVLHLPFPLDGPCALI